MTEVCWNCESLFASGIFPKFRLSDITSDDFDSFSVFSAGSFHIHIMPSPSFVSPRELEFPFRQSPPFNLLRVLLTFSPSSPFVVLILISPALAAFWWRLWVAFWFIPSFLGIIFLDFQLEGQPSVFLFFCGSLADIAADEVPSSPPDDKDNTS